MMYTRDDLLAILRQSDGDFDDGAGAYVDVSTEETGALVFELTNGDTEEVTRFRVEVTRL